MKPFYRNQEPDRSSSQVVGKATNNAGSKMLRMNAHQECQPNSPDLKTVSLYNINMTNSKLKHTVKEGDLKRKFQFL